MAHPVCWPSGAPFCPMGIEAATSLTQDLSPEQSADILLLGCGEPRHILYTLSTDVTCPPVPRKLDITCCDIEPAVLARNIVMFTLLEDDTLSNHVWDIFYHFKLSEHTFALVTNHSRKLADLAETPGSWRQSKYGSFIKMVDAASLSELRRLWTMYAEFPNLPSARLEKLQEEQENMSKLVSQDAKRKPIPELSRSAANAWREALEPVNDEFIHYWDHGTTATTNKDIKKTTKLNPTFCYSSLGETFKIFTATFPRGYHFAAAFIPLSSDPAGPITNSAMTKAKQQFKAGCVAFRASRQAKSIVLRVFTGDALALCRALDLYNKSNNPKTTEFAAPWRATPIDLTEHAMSSPAAPDSFDIIDCAMLPTYLGLFNLLLVGQPLLKKQTASQAVLYADLTLHRDFPAKLLWKRLCSSIPATGILIGLVPRPYVSLFTSTSNTHELTFHRGGPRPTFYKERIPWVNPTGGDEHTYTTPSPAICFSDDLVHLLFVVYYWMFDYDTLSPTRIQKLSPDELQFNSEPRFIRETFAILVAHVKNRVHLLDSDWKGVVDKLIVLAAAHAIDNSLRGHFYDLQNQFRLRGLEFSPIVEEPYDLRTSPIFRGWADVPRLVCVVLLVPASKLDPIRKHSPDPTICLRLECGYRSDIEELDLVHSSIHTVWGSCVPLEGSGSKYVIEEDSEGHHGKSDLIVSFWTDAEMLTVPGTSISLNLRRTPLAFTKYQGVLGPMLNLYTAEIVDKEHVLILCERPMGLSQTQKANRHISSSMVVAEDTKYQINVKLGGPKTDVESITARVQLESRAEQVELDKVDRATVIQVGPCTLELSFGSAKHTLRFPYPIRGSDSKVNVDKRLYCINVTVPFFQPIETGGYPSQMFPILQHTSPSTWNIHHLHIDRMPKVDIRQRDKLRDWLTTHTTIQLSDRERVIQRSTHPTKLPTSEVLVNLKESIAGIVRFYVGISDSETAPLDTFSLIEPNHGVYVIIFVVGLRLDLAGASVALDAAVVSISAESATQLTIPANILHTSGKILQVRTRPAEVIAWKQLLPAFVERGRTWSHEPNCRYRSAGKVPLSVDIEVDCLCKCGQGMGFNAPEWRVPAWQGLLPYATRAVISPLFGVSYLETVAGPAAWMVGSTKPVSWAEPTDVCWQCAGIGRPLLICRKCNKARYCSKECQRIHWKEEHKHVCAGR